MADRRFIRRIAPIGAFFTGDWILSDSVDSAAVNQGHPKGLYLLFVTEMAERFSYYGMRALFVLYLVSAFFTSSAASEIYGSYTGLVYLTPLLGGYIADRYWGNRRSIIAGGLIMAVGQFLMFLSACFVTKSLNFGPTMFTKGFPKLFESLHLEWPIYGEINPNVDNSLSLMLMFTGLVALILGNGFFKPNISTMVGDLYEKSDKRRDSAFTIFYMGINVGAFIAPLVCGALAVAGSWYNPGGFKWGFFCACIGMCLSVLVFWTLKNKLLVTPEGVQIGLPPSAYKSKDDDKSSDNADAKNDADASTEKAANANSPIRLVGCALGAVGLFSLFFLPDIISGNPFNFNALISSVIYTAAIILPVFIITDRTLSRNEKKHIGVIYIIALFVVFFWSAFEQAGSSLTLFADKQVDRTMSIPSYFLSWQGWVIIQVIVAALTAAYIVIRFRKKQDGVYHLTTKGFELVLQGIIGFAVIELIVIVVPWIVLAIGGISLADFEMPTAWFQSVNPIVVVTFAPIMAALWQFLNKRGIEPSSPVKQATGLMLLSIGYFVITFATYGVSSATKVSMLWLLILYFIHTIGELCLSPIGLSMVTKLSPKHLASLLMGVWFMSNAASNILAGKLAMLLPEAGKPAKILPVLDIPISSLDQFFLIFAVMSAVASVLLFLLCPLLKKMMADIK